MKHNASARRLANRQVVDALRAATVCAHCGGQPVEWHNPEHVQAPGRRVSTMVYDATVTEADIVAEVARCTPLCRRCHMREDGREAKVARAGAAARYAHLPKETHTFVPWRPDARRCGACGRRPASHEVTA